MRCVPGAVVLVATLAFAQASTFEAANAFLAEESLAKACEGFEAFLTANPGSPLTREATAKRAYACWRTGKRSEGANELTKLANDTQQQDFAAAFAQWALAVQGYVNVQQALSPLKKAARADGRTGAEAKRLLVSVALKQLDNSLWDPKTAESLTELVLATATSEPDKAHARFARAQAWLRNQPTQGKAEQELTSVGAGNTEWADDALFALGRHKEGRGTYTDALSIYDGIVKRFSSTTSNRHAEARAAAEDIRRPVLSVSAYQVGLPGLKVPVQLSWRNLTKASLTLRRIDVLAPAKNASAEYVDAFLPGSTVERTWTETLEVPTPYAPGSRTLELALPSTGAFVLVATAETLSATDFVVSTPLAMVTRTDRRQLQAFVVDAESGAAQPDVEVLLSHGSDGRRLTGRTNADGLVAFKVTESESQSTLTLWARKGTAVTHATAGSAWWSSTSKQNLAYVMTDRPLYKPGETVGLKLFLRSRDAGPAVPVPDRTVTLRVYDPNGKEALSAKVTSNAFGTATAALPIGKNATLGAWRVDVDDPSESWQHPSSSFRVEEFKPPEATVSVAPLKSAKPGEPARLKVTAKYYSGGPLTNAQGRALVTVTRWQHRFAPWADEVPQVSNAWGDDEYRPRRYRSDGEDDWYQLASHTLQFKTGADGTAEIEVPATPDSGGDQQVSVQVFVTDVSRREISGTGTARLSRAPWFVDVRSERFLYRPGERVTLQLRAEDANARPVSPEVIVRLSRIADASTGASSRIAETRTKVQNGVGLVQLDADALGPVRVDVVNPLVDVDAEGALLATTDLWLTSDTRPLPPPGPGFQLLTDRAPVKAGETLRVLVVTPEPGGHAWLTLEHDLVVLSRVVTMNGRTKYVELTVPPEAAPNAVLVLDRYQHGEGLQHQKRLSVKGSEVELDVKVAFDRQVAAPGASVPVTVATTKAPAGPLETALTVVDEALFAIEPERQDFLSFFGTQPRQHTVRTARSTDWRRFMARPRAEPAAEPKTPRPAGEKEIVSEKATMAPESPAPVVARALEEAPGRQESKRKSADGPSKDDEADRSGADAAPVKPRTDFGSSAGWYPTLTGRVGAPLQQAVKVTDSLTSWKAIATVVSQGPHLGRGAATMRTAMPLMVRLQAPRFVIEGDEVVLSAVIESHLPKPSLVDVAISAPGLSSLGPAKRQLQLAPEQILRFDARFKVTSPGDQKLRAEVRAGATADAMELTIPALVHGSAQRQFFSGRLTDSFSFDVELPQRRKAALTRLELTLSPTLLSVMLDGLPYLAQYPYGCVEQTLSRFVPATIARKAAKDLKLPAERLPKDLDDMVQKGLERLAGFQHGDGGWGWWQTDKTNLWMTAYVLYALALARDAGVAVDAGMLSRGQGWLVSHLGEALDTPDTHAFAVFALAQAGAAPKAALSQAFERRASLSPRGKALVALALLAAKDPRARIAVENLDDVVKAAQARSDASVGDANDAWSTSAAIEATAYTLMAMSRWSEGAKYVAPLTDFLVLRRNGGRWRNTRDTAFAIYALAELARRERADSQRATFAVSINGRAVKQLRSERGGLDLTPLLFSDADFKPGRNQITIRRDGGGTGYWAATWDVFNQNDFIKGVGGDVKVSRSYTLLGKPSTEPGRAPTEYGMPVESGVRVRVDLELTANKAVEFVMLEDLKPAGFEAVQQRSGPEVCNYACAHAELRADRVALFLSELRVGTTKLSYELRAETPGRFAALPARAEAMYAPELQATADEMRFEVRDAPASGVASQ